MAASGAWSLSRGSRCPEKEGKTNQERGVTANGYEVFFGGDGSVHELDGSGERTVWVNH